MRKNRIIEDREIEKRKDKKRNHETLTKAKIKRADSANLKGCTPINFIVGWQWRASKSPTSCSLNRSPISAPLFLMNVSGLNGADAERTNKFLDSNSLDILPNAGKISHDQAIDKATAEYEQFRIEQDKNYISDLDKALKKLQNKKSDQWAA